VPSLATPRADRGEVVLFWPALVAIDRAAEAVGKVGRAEKRELEQFRRPLAERLDETGTSARDPATSAAHQQKSVIAALAAATQRGLRSAASARQRWRAPAW
jgi:hypothetical protein